MIAIGWLVPVALAAQTPDAGLIAPDSGRVIRRAQAAQEAFESDRRRRLPIIPTGTGRCEERIGRFCYWYDDRDTSLPREPESVKTARERLNATLARAHAERPASSWLLGQRVRYLLEDRQTDAALGVATTCGATPWWCSALAGLVLHVAEQFAGADSAFDHALTAMPDDLRCAWTDWTVILDAQAADLAKKVPCEDRRRFADSLLLLAKPFLAGSGNDLRTELLARRTMAALHAAARSPHFIPWGKDMEELMLRYGWSTHWSVGDRPTSTLESAAVTGHQRSPSYQFFPTRGDGGEIRWTLKPDRARFRYAPTYADRFTLTDEGQIARFPRGDSTIVVAGAGPADTAVALTAVGRSESSRVTARLDPGSPLGGLVARLAGDLVIAGREAQTANGRLIAATRVAYGATEPSPLTLSDPLFFLAGPELPETLEAAAARALPVNRVSKEVPVGIYWEATGEASDTVDVAVSIVPIRRGFLGRIGEGLSLVKRRAPMTLQWKASGGAFELDLRSQKPGQYLLRLEARAGGTTATSQRAFHLMP